MHGFQVREFFYIISLDKHQIGNPTQLLSEITLIQSRKNLNGAYFLKDSGQTIKNSSSRITVKYSQNFPTVLLRCTGVLCRPPSTFKVPKGNFSRIGEMNF